MDFLYIFNLYIFMWIELKGSGVLLIKVCRCMKQFFYKDILSYFANKYHFN